MIIDDQTRADEAGQRADALIYGEFDATRANQILALGGGGNVGINTTNPQNTLNVIGDGNFTGDLILEGGDIIGAGNAILDIGEATTSDFTFYDTTDADEYVEFNCRDNDSTSLCQFNTGLYVASGPLYVNDNLLARGGIYDDQDEDMMISSNRGMGFALDYDADTGAGEDF